MEWSTVQTWVQSDAGLYKRIPATFPVTITKHTSILVYTEAIHVYCWFKYKGMILTFIIAM